MLSMSGGCLEKWPKSTFFEYDIEAAIRNILRAIGKGEFAESIRSRLEDPPMMAGLSSDNGPLPAWKGSGTGANRE